MADRLVALILPQQHNCPRYLGVSNQPVRLQVQYHNAESGEPYEMTISRARCEACGQGIPMDVVYDVHFEKRVTAIVRGAVVDAPPTDPQSSAP